MKALFVGLGLFIAVSSFGAGRFLGDPEFFVGPVGHVSRLGPTDGSIKEIARVDDKVCYTDDGGLHCKGTWPFRDLEEEFNSSQEIAVGRSEYCFIENGNAICRGCGLGSQYCRVPKMEKVKRIEVGCAETESEFVFWGRGDELRVSKPEEVLQWVSSSQQVCFTTRSEVRCVSTNGNTTFSLSVTGQKVVSLGLNDSVCVAHSGGVDCWKRFWDGYKEKTHLSDESFLDFKFFDGYYRLLCGVSKEEVRCWETDSINIKPIEIEPKVRGQRFFRGSKQARCVENNGQLNCFSQKDQPDNYLKHWEGIPGVQAIFNGQEAIINGKWELRKGALILPPRGVRKSATHLASANAAGASATGTYHRFCFHSGRKVHCLRKDPNESFPNMWDTLPEDVSSIEGISLSGKYLCVLDQGKPRCWNEINEPLNVSFGDLSEVVLEVASGDEMVCIRTRSETRCWDGKTGKNSVLKFGNSAIPPATRLISSDWNSMGVIAEGDFYGIHRYGDEIKSNSKQGLLQYYRQSTVNAWYTRTSSYSTSYHWIFELIDGSLVSGSFLNSGSHALDIYYAASRSKRTEQVFIRRLAELMEKSWLELKKGKGILENVSKNYFLAVPDISDQYPGGNFKDKVPTYPAKGNSDNRRFLIAAIRIAIEELPFYLMSLEDQRTGLELAKKLGVDPSEGLISEIEKYRDRIAGNTWVKIRSVFLTDIINTLKEISND